MFFQRNELPVGDNTTLIVVGINKTNHNDRNTTILDQVNKIKDNLASQNSKIGKVLIKTYANEENFIEQMPSMLDEVVKGFLEKKRP
jgi:hypothetical protein